MTTEQERERELLAEAQVASIASPVALGFASFALPLFIWGVINADFFDQSSLTFLIPVALVYGGLAQIAAAMWSFRKHDGLLALAFGTFGAFWISYGMLLWMQRAEFLRFEAGTEQNLMGLFFLSWAIPAAYIWLAAVARGNYAIAATLLLADAAFLSVMAGYYADSSTWREAGGWLAVVGAAVAWYTSAAEIINHTVTRMVLPTHYAPLGTDLEQLERHPGHMI